MKRILHPASCIQHRLHSRDASGFVLIVVLVICLGLVSLTLVFGHAMLMAYRGAETDVVGRQADRAVEGAVQYAEYLMTNSGTVNSGTSAVVGYMLPDPTVYQSEAVPVGDATFWFIGEPASTDATDTPAFGLVDEASKLNLNTASAAMLENLPNMTQDLAEAIIAWRKASSGTSSTTTTGTSSSSGGGTVKGGPFESIFELSQVVSQDGDDPTILYGDDANLNHVLDSNETQSGQFNPGIFEYVTVFSREPNTASDGTMRINVTTGGAPLNTLLSTLFGETRSREIQRGTRGAPVRSVLEYYIRSGMTPAEFDRITPYLTMSNGAFATGLVNVNTASETVLACIPGITAQLAAQLVSTRANQTTPYTNLAWVAQILGNAAAVQAGPYLTTQTYQVTADVAAVGRNGRGYRRTLFVIDGSTGTPQVVYRHNMGFLGWALGPTAMQNLGQNGLNGKQNGQQKSMP